MSGCLQLPHIWRVYSARCGHALPRSPYSAGSTRRCDAGTPSCVRRTCQATRRGAPRTRQTSSSRCVAGQDPAGCALCCCMLCSLLCHLAIDIVLPRCMTSKCARRHPCRAPSGRCCSATPHWAHGFLSWLSRCVMAATGGCLAASLFLAVSCHAMQVCLLLVGACTRWAHARTHPAQYSLLMACAFPHCRWRMV
jgi:hypothetical protein